MRKHETTYTDPSGGGSASFAVAVPTDEYKENISYDPNRNILTYVGDGITSNLGMDNLSYHSPADRNQLEYVTDGAPAGNYSDNSISNSSIVL